MAYYNLRYLQRHWTRYLTALLSLAAATATIVVPAAAFDTFSGLMRASSETDNVVILSRGGSGEMFPSLTKIDRSIVSHVRALAGVAKDKNGEPLVSPEYIYTASYDHGGRTHRIIVRGVGERAFDVHAVVRLSEGRLGPGEMLVGSGLRRLFPDLKIGDQIDIAGRTWKIGGMFEPTNFQTQFDSELWVHVEDLMAARKALWYGPITVKATSPEEVRAIAGTVNKDQNVFKELRAVDEHRLSAGMFQTLGALGAVHRLLSGLLMVIAALAVLNVLLTNVARRRADMAILRALGFGRFDIVRGFMIEGTSLAFAAALLGGLLSMAANDMTFETASLLRGGVVVLRLHIGFGTLLTSVLIGIAVGCVCSVVPALYATRVSIREELRTD